MGANLFKIKYLPNNDGTDSSILLTNSNTIFFHTYLGDDITGNGSREKPFKSFSKSLTFTTYRYFVFRGLINEFFSFYAPNDQYLIGDDKNQNFITSNYPSFHSFLKVTNLTIDKKFSSQYGLNYINCRVLESSSVNDTFYNGLYYSLFEKLLECGQNSNPTIDHCTFNGFSIKITINYSVSQNRNCLIASSFNIAAINQEVWSTLINFTFLSSCVFKYLGVNIIHPIWTNDSKENFTLIKLAYAQAGMSQEKMDILFPKDSFGNERGFIIKELKDSGLSANVFNKYSDTLSGTITAAIIANQAKTSIQLTVTDTSLFPTTGDIFIPNIAGDGFEVFTYTSVTINSSTLITFNGASYTFKVAHDNGATCTRYGDVLDFTLNPDVTNEALWASDTGGYVGCFRPAESVTIDSGISIIDVNTDGSDTVNSGDLISVDGSDNLVFNSGSAQVWNRLRDSSTINIPLGSNFKGLNAMSQDGSPFGNYIGKKQNLIDSSVLNPGDTLTVGTWYKIFNDVSKDVTKAIIYNGVQYLPSYTFLCIAGVTVFSLLNSGSGSYVKKINVDVLESIEMLPYDDATTPSAFPKFSAPLMGECKLLFYTAAGATRYGKTSGNPVMFGDLAGTNFATDFPGCNDKIAYYDGYAISNADQEFFTLANPSLTSPKSTYFTTSIPILRFLRREINAHFDVDYSY